MTDTVEGDYWRDGAVCVRGALEAAAVDLARRAIDANLAALSPRAKRASAADDGAFVEDFCNWQRVPALEEFVRTSGVARIAGELMGSRVVRLYHDHVLVKEPGTRQRTPWHQDLPYYNVHGRSNISMWKNTASPGSSAHFSTSKRSGSSSIGGSSSSEPSGNHFA